MNERIKELKKQAFDEVWDLDNDPIGPGTHFIPDGFEKKFAELIVTECCQALNPMLRDMISRGQGVDMIKLHFEMNPNEITTAMLDRTINQCEQQLAEKKND